MLTISLRLAAWPLVLATALVAPRAFAKTTGVDAKEVTASSAEPDEGYADEGEPHTLFLAQVGVLGLPAAEVCPSTSASCEPGEAGIGVGLLGMGRIGDFGFGAGFIWGAGLRTSEAAGEPELGVDRQQTRNYLLIEGAFRYYLPPVSDPWKWWLGADAGLVVVNDSWSTLPDREPFGGRQTVGPQAVTLSTEGFALGLAVGGQWRFLEHWVIGTHARYQNWFLPSERDRSPVGDLASLAGRIDVVDVGISGGFRLPL